jgi:hypothetical protein
MINSNYHAAYKQGGKDYPLHGKFLNPFILENFKAFS